MRVLTENEMNMIAGGGNYADNVRDAANSKRSQAVKNKNNNGGFYGGQGTAVTNCNTGIIGGMVAGSIGGVPGMALGLVGGALAGGCFGQGNNNGGGSGSSSSNCGNNNGGCSW